MNESYSFNPFAIKNFCRVCLKTTNDLYPMSNEHKNWYRNIVEEVEITEHDVKTCTICLWMLKRFQKFKLQCQSANNFLKGVVYLDSKSLVFVQTLTSSHHMIQTKTETNEYHPLTHPTNSHYDTFEHANNYDNNPLNNKKIHTTFNEISVGNKFKSSCSTHNKHGILDPADKNTVKREKDETIYTYDETNDETNDRETNDYETNDNVDNDDELPLVLLCKKVKKEAKKRKKKKKIVKEMNTNIEELIKQEESEVPKVKRAKVLRDGFTSRMVQETDEYIVIKLTRDQVLQEMSDRSKTDAFTLSAYKCERCVKAFNFDDVLQTHMDKHSMKNGTFQCDMCHQYCPSAVSLRGHIKSHTTRYKCKLCGQIRLSRQHLLEHYANTHTNAGTTYSCDYCQFTSNKRTVMQRHVRRHTAREPLPCHKCGKLFKSVESLRLHTVRHDVSSLVSCDRCERTFPSRALVARHAATHNTRDYYCVECDVQFTCAESLRLHFKKAKKHRDSSAYNHACPSCPSRFPTAGTLATHNSSAHGAPRAHACMQCKRMFSNKDAVRAHTWRVHSRGEARVSCAHCGEGFNRKSALKLHILTHRDEKIPHTHAPAKHKKEYMQQYENKIEV